MTDTPEDTSETLTTALKTYTPPAPSPLAISPYVAMSLLQKAIRRGRTQLAHRAAATLMAATLMDNPDRLWRRLGVIAVEDIGLGNPRTVEHVALALIGKAFRRQFGGDWKVASYLIEQLAKANKCRAADDLLLVASRHPTYLQARLELGYQTREELAGMIMGRGPLVERAIALLYLLGTDRDTRDFVGRRGDPRLAHDALSKLGCADQFLAIAHGLFRRTGEPLGPLVALLSREAGWESGTPIDDPLPQETIIDDVPGWAYDMFTREGRKVFGAFLSGRTKSARWINSHVPPRSRLDVVGGLVFTLEGGQLTQRLRWPVGDHSRHMAERECLEGCPDTAEVLALLRHDIPALNHLRRKLLGGRNA